MNNTSTMKPVEELDLLDRFMFETCIKNTDICRTILELSLSQNLPVLKRNQAEAVLEPYVDSRAVRLDLLAYDEENTVYDAEAQAKDTKNIPKRSRFYQAHLDVSLLAPGVTDFNLLNDSYVVFICDFDCFGLKKYRYTFRKKCDEAPDMALGDGAVRVFLNTKGTNDDEVPEELVEFLKYLDRDNKDKKISNPKIGKVEAYIANLKKSHEFGVNYMRDWEEKEIARHEGWEAGHESGLTEGHERGLSEGMAVGHERGLSEGLTIGRENGISEGIELGEVRKQKEIARNIFTREPEMTNEEAALLLGITEPEVVRLREELGI